MIRIFTLLLLAAAALPAAEPIRLHPGNARYFLFRGKPTLLRATRYVVDRTPHTTQLELDLPAGSYRVEWIDTKTGQAVKQERFSHKGGGRTLASPQYTEDIALRVWVR